MKITVTQEDIIEGRQRCDGLFSSSQNCPIALALRRATVEPNIGVGLWTLHAGKEVYYLPNDAQLFVRAFDGGQEVAPFEFEVMPKETA